jgi:hypothetical protein
LKKGIHTAICCPCGNEKILALGRCATCYTLKRQDAEYFGGLREQVLARWIRLYGCWGRAGEKSVERLVGRGWRGGMRVFRKSMRQYRRVSVYLYMS